MKNLVKAICVIIGTIIGAGFASGKEIYIFFNQYGIRGIYGIIISTMLIGIIVYKILVNIKDTEIQNYNEYLNSTKIHNKSKEIINIIINIFLLISFYIMIAGFCAYFYQEFKVPSLIVGAIVCVMCYITFMNNIEGITKINIIVIPFLIFMIIFIAIKSNIWEIENYIVTNNSTNSKWILACLEYVGYNSIVLIPMLIELKKYTKGREKSIAIIVSIIFLGLAIILYLILQKMGNSAQNIELPLIQSVKQIKNSYKYIYGAVIVFAIYTSAISAGYSFAQNCSKNKNTYKIICAVICITAIPISKIGFSNLVSLLYPIFGILGLVLNFIYILFQKDLKKTRKTDIN